MRNKVIDLIVLLMVFSLGYAQEITISIAAGQQVVPSVATDGTDFFAVWEDARAGTGNPNIYGRIISAGGSLPGLESPVCAFMNYQKIPDVAWDGTYYLGVWFDRRAGYQVYGNLLNPDGTLYLGNYNICTVDGSIQNVRTSGMEGAFIVLWEERLMGISDLYYSITKSDMSSTIRTQLGEPDGSEKNPAIARGDSAWIAVYEDSLASGKGIFAQSVTYGPGGSDISAMIEISAVTNDESYPSIAYGEDGYLVVFEREGGVTNRDIFGVILDYSGAPIGSAFPISTATGNQIKPSISFDGIGYLVVWQDNRDLLSDIYGQRISTNGTLIGPEIAVSTATGTQQKPHSTSNSEHHLVIWEDSRDVTSDIYATRIPAMTISSAPEVMILQPSPFVVTSCDRYPIKMLIEDPDGIDPFSLLFYNGSDTVNGYSSSVVFIGDTFRYTPSSDWPNGSTIDLSLVDINDSLGNHIDSPINWSFTADLGNPVIDNLIPRAGQVLTVFPAVISANLTDSITGIDISTLIMVFDGDTLFFPDSRLSWDGFTIRLTPDTTGLMIGTHSVSIKIGDSPDVCDPNYVTMEWDFFVNPSGGPNATAVLPRNGDVVASATPGIEILISDPDGIDETSIEISVGGVMYSWPNPSMSFSDSILTVASSSIFIHEQIVAVNLMHARDDIGSDLESPLTYSFVVDLEPPVAGTFFPNTGDTLHVGTEDIWIVAQDEPAGITVDPSHISFEFFDLSMDLIETAMAGMTSRGDTLVLQSGAFGSALDDGSEIIICANLSDSPDVYEPNDTSYCWQVYIELMAISERELPGQKNMNVMPNPFNAGCIIQFQGTVEIYDISGKLIDVLDDCSKGVLWTGKDRGGASVPSGIYLVKGRNTGITEKAVLLR
ncbi:hypothetical protein KAH81_10120 [bacterium]|nr:hypothetical protein [bacterium]